MIIEDFSTSIKGSPEPTQIDSLSSDRPILTQDELKRHVSHIRYDLTTAQIQFLVPLRCIQDLPGWQQAIEKEFVESEIDCMQWSDAAILFLEGDVNIEMRKRRSRRGGGWIWEEFLGELSDVLNEIDSRLSTLEQFRQDHPVASSVAKVAGTGLAIAGASVLVPAVGVGVLNAAGFTSSGVAGGSMAAGIQSWLYGGATTGVFSVCQSIGATAVAASPGAVISAVGSVAAGVGLFKGSKTNTTPQVPPQSSAENTSDLKSGSPPPYSRS